MKEQPDEPCHGSSDSAPRGRDDSGRNRGLDNVPWPARLKVAPSDGGRPPGAWGRAMAPVPSRRRSAGWRPPSLDPARGEPRRPRARHLDARRGTDVWMPKMGTRRQTREPVTVDQGSSSTARSRSPSDLRGPVHGVRSAVPDLQPALPRGPARARPKTTIRKILSRSPPHLHSIRGFDYRYRALDPGAPSRDVTHPGGGRPGPVRQRRRGPRDTPG